MITAIELLKQQGWRNRPSGDGSNAAIETCPFCKNTNYKFFINITGAEKDGLFSCKVCNKEGNLYQLRDELGLTMKGVSSIQDAAADKVAPKPLPNLAFMHTRLVEDEKFGDILDYLIHVRKFTMDVIKKQRLGAEIDDKGRKWYIIPYLDAAGSPTYYKGRSVLDPIGSKKGFKSPAGREAGLYNDTVITQDMDELVIVEGEADALSLMSQGYPNVVAVPGATIKKTTWIDLLDQMKPKMIYLCYDKDKVGQESAKLMAAKIGLDRVRNVVLPVFLKEDAKEGKDLNEYFVSGKTLENFRELMAQAKPFEVTGIQPVNQVLSELMDELDGKGTTATYDTPWPALTKRVGGFEDGDLVGVMAEAKVGKTTVALNILHYYSCKGFPTLMYCQEMPPKRMVRKWVSHVMQCDDTPGKSQMTSAITLQSLDIARQMQSDILFGFTPSCKIEEVFDTIRQAVRRYGVKVVCFDNLQMMVRSLEHSANETSKITKMFKSLAIELNILILLIVQPHRVAEGTIVSARNAMGSSAIEKDVDTMICLHRNRVGGQMREKDFTGYVETDDNFEPHLLCRVDLSRYAPGGTCTLMMNGATSTVTEYDAGGGTTQTKEAEAVTVSEA